jgi:hypothetical protein
VRKLDLQLGFVFRDGQAANFARRPDARTSPYTVGASRRKLACLDYGSSFRTENRFIGHAVTLPTG